MLGRRWPNAMKSTASQTAFRSCFVPSIEHLEARVAPALVVAANHLSATFTDVDGDLVTIRASKPILDDLDFIRAASGLGEQLQLIDFSDDEAAMVKGLNLIITAKPRDPNPDDADTTKRGDKLVNIGYLNATGRDLGAIRITGDLGQITAGTGSTSVPAVKSLSVGSMGEFAVTTGASSTLSEITGTLGTLAIKGNLRGVTVQTLSGGKIGSAIIRGSIVGFGDNGQLVSAGGMGAVKIGGDIVGGVSGFPPAPSGFVFSGGALKSVTVAGSIIGNNADKAGSIGSSGPLGTVKIGGDVIGANARDCATIFSDSTIQSVSIAGSLIGSFFGGHIHAAGKISNITIGHDLVGANIEESGRIYTTNGADIGNVTINGSIIGGNGSKSGSIESAGKLGIVKVGHDLVGGRGNSSGSIISTDATAGISVGGSIVGGAGSFSGNILVTSDLAKVKIAGDIRGGAGISSGSLLTNTISSLSVGGSLIGNADATPGDSHGSGSIRATSRLGTAKIGGSLIGGDNLESGAILVTEDITSIVVGGSLIGGPVTGDSAPDKTGVIIATGTIGTVNIRGDLRGSDQFGSQTSDTGSVDGKRIGSITVGGSLIAGAGNSVRGGAIVASEDIGSVVVKGGMLGNSSNHAVIFAHGLAENPVENNFAIKRITIGGSVEQAWIFAGVDNNGVADNGNAQVGRVSVGGDWIASSMVSGCTSTDGIIGDNNDAAFGGGTMSKIASILIKGQVLGQAGTNNIFGFVAQTIGSFKYNGIIVPLTPGASNDTFALGKARPVGASLSTVNADGFAVHIVEV
jgi:hypothetical protein